MNYVNEAVRTLSNEFHTEQVKLHGLYSRIEGAILAAAELDKCKKALFYGRQYPELTAPVPDLNTCDFDVALHGVHMNPERAQQIVHGIIGLYTEAGELLEALLKAMLSGQKLDLVNVVEEIGDGKWYMAVLAHAIGYQWGDDEAINVNKLRARFPDKFTEQGANTRDLDGERAILERGTEASTETRMRLAAEAASMSYGEEDTPSTNASLARDRIGEQHGGDGMAPARKFFSGDTE